MSKLFTTTSEIKNKLDLPTFITNSLPFQKINRVYKAFPEIGLTNFTEDVNVQINSRELNTASRELLKEILSSSKERLEDIYYKYVSQAKKISSNREAILKSIINILCQFNKMIEENEKLFDSVVGKKIVVNENGKLKLRSNTEIFDEHLKFKTEVGQSILSIYEKINDALKLGKFLPMRKINEGYWFKKFSSLNIPSKNLQIVFSSHGLQGAWDIATMSQRGIKSCQSWDGQYKTCLVGSIIDPFIAIMYLKNTKSQNMIARCLVKILKDSGNNKTVIWMDKMYPNDSSDYSELFTNYLKPKLKGDIEIRSVYLNSSASLETQYSPTSDLLALYSEIEINKRNIFSTGELIKSSYDYGYNSYQDTYLKRNLNRRNIFAHKVSAFELLKITIKNKTFKLINNIKDIFI